MNILTSMILSAILIVGGCFLYYLVESKDFADMKNQIKTAFKNISFTDISGFVQLWIVVTFILFIIVNVIGLLTGLGYHYDINMWSGIQDALLFDPIAMLWDKL